MAARAPLARFESRGGARIYRLPVETFFGQVNNVYLVLDPRQGGVSTLVDVGSGLPRSTEDLHAGFEAVRTDFGERVRVESVQHVLVTHSHVDHFGHLGWFRTHGAAELSVHELDVRVLESFEEAIVLACKELRVFLERSGVETGEREDLEEMYRAGKSFFKSIRIDRRLRDGDRLGPGYVVHHVPGHCPGQVCLQVDDVLLTADHVLARTTPHQFPGSVAPFCGLGLYLASLEKIARLPGIRLALPGHEAEVRDLPGRIEAIAAHHRARLARVLAICGRPRTVAEVTLELFGARRGYGRLLALLEAGAHVEYLFQLGDLAVANLDQVASEPSPPVLYERRGAV